VIQPPRRPRPRAVAADDLRGFGVDVVARAIGVVQAGHQYWQGPLPPAIQVIPIVPIERVDLGVPRCCRGGPDDAAIRWRSNSGCGSPAIGTTREPPSASVARYTGIAVERRELELAHVEIAKPLQRRAWRRDERRELHVR
jgi:hypothetical protein